MADPADKNNQPRRDDGKENEQPTKTPKSSWSEDDKKPSQQPQPGRPQLRHFPTMPADMMVEWLRLTRHLLRHACQTLVVEPLAYRAIFIFDKILSCTIQALRWALSPFLTEPHTEDNELPPQPRGTKLAQAVQHILRSFDVTLSISRLRPHDVCRRHKAVTEEMSCYRRDLAIFQPARPYTVELPAAAGDTPAWAPRYLSTRGQVKPYYSPPRFIKGWKNTGEKRQEKKKHGSEGEPKDSETQDGDQQTTAAAEEAEAAFVFGRPPPTPPPSGGPPAAGGARGPPAGAPHRLLSLFGTKIA